MFLTVLSTLCSNRAVHTVLFWPCYLHCVVLTVLSTLCCSDRAVHCFNVFVLFLTVLSTLCCSDRVVHTVLLFLFCFWPCCPHCVVLTVQSTLCCSDSDVHTVLLFLFCFVFDRVVHTVLFWPCCRYCLLTVLSTLFYCFCFIFDLVVHTVLLFLFCFWPCCPHCVVLTVLSIQRYKYIHSPLTLKYTQEFVLVTLHSHCALTIRTLQLAMHKGY